MRLSEWEINTVSPTTVDFHSENWNFGIFSGKHHQNHNFMLICTVQALLLNRKLPSANSKESRERAQRRVTNTGCGFSAPGSRTSLANNYLEALDSPLYLSSFSFLHWNTGQIKTPALIKSHNFYKEQRDNTWGNICELWHNIQMQEHASVMLTDAVIQHTPWTQPIKQLGLIHSNWM